MKKLLTTLLLISLCIILNGCATSNVDIIAARKICNFVQIFSNVNVGLGYESNDSIFVDTNTGVLYVRDWNSGLSPIYNADGSLKIWKGEIPE